MKTISFTIAGLLLIIATIVTGQVPIRPGMVIKQSTTFQPGQYNITSDSIGTPIITIEGNNITLDFKEVKLNGATAGQLPDTFKGLAILIKNSRNVIIKNLQARGYKVALMAVNVDSLQLLNSDLSYNYRQKLFSIRERENFQDWLSYHHNEKEEWLRYGAAVYLKNCNNALVKGLHITQGQNGIMMTNCNDGLFYNNIIEFNSGIGIGMYRSSRNKIMHNRLNFSVRGYSHGFYSRGQDSAGILVYEQCNNNVFAYNSATHSGDGFFLWAGQHTMDTGEGGCNGNILYENDFSFSPTNGIEVTFSSNRIVKNKLEGCTHGIWGGYSYNTYIAGNHFINNKYGIAIEHGQHNTIEYNAFENNDIAVQLWERLTQPGDWGYANKRDVKSHDYNIRHNIFNQDSIPFKIAATAKVAINDDNEFLGFDKLLIAEKPNEEFYLVKNNIYGTVNWGDVPAINHDRNRLLPQPRKPFNIKELTNRMSEQQPPYAMSDSISVAPPLRGNRSLIRVNEWGPYNYQYPSVWLDSIQGENYQFTLLGPQGTWRVKRAEGLLTPELLPSGNFMILKAVKDSKATFILLELEFIGKQNITNQLGEVIPVGQPMLIRFNRAEKKLDWKVRWYAYNDVSDPLQQYDAFKKLAQQKPLQTAQIQELAYVWWNKPADNIPADKFATFAETTFDITKGKYKIILTSDDGVKLYLDGKLLINNWNIHESVVNEIEVELNGKHKIEIEHFDAAGLANLELRLEKTW
ncbi:MAG: right-handed parallel beta-helix repeat-containing protein [Saprospiraceae bacterium]